MRVALATCHSMPALSPDDQSLVPALASLGVAAVPAIWSDQTLAWTAFDAVVIRSCWDYHLCLSDFTSWLDRLEVARIPVFNTPALVRWNANKRYLFDLSRTGVPTIPTRVLGRASAADIVRVVSAEGWRRFVIKPAVSASGYGTYAFTTPLDDEALNRLARATSMGDLLVQPFLEEVSHDGEYSFTFIGGAFSHAALKRTAPGEFRVQTEHGGSVAAVAPSPRLVAQAAAALGALPEAPLYARVDGIVRHDTLLLMELELIEPNLFLSLEPGAAHGLARAIAARLA